MDKTQLVVDRLRQQILERFGTEGLDALETVAADPDEATPWEKLTVQEICEWAADQSEPEPSD